MVETDKKRAEFIKSKVELLKESFCYLDGEVMDMSMENEEAL
jgi:hypothetical protein